MADDVAFDGEVADVDLHLAGDEEAVLRGGPLGIEVAEGGDGGVVAGRLGEGFLHRALHEAVGEGEAAGEGEGLGEEGDRGRGLRLVGGHGGGCDGERCWEGEGGEGADGFGGCGRRWKDSIGDIHRDMELSFAMVFMTPQLDLPCLQMRLYLAGLAGSRIENGCFSSGGGGGEGDDRVEIRGLISKGIRPLLMRRSDTHSSSAREVGFNSNDLRAVARVLLR